MVSKRQQTDKSLGKETKAQWDRPRLAYLGKVGDLVRGFGKTGTTGDSDPALTTKTGVG